MNDLAYYFVCHHAWRAVCDAGKLYLDSMNDERREDFDFWIEFQVSLTRNELLQRTR